MGANPWYDTADGDAAAENAAWHRHAAGDGQSWGLSMLQLQPHGGVVEVAASKGPREGCRRMRIVCRWQVHQREYELLRGGVDSVASVSRRMGSEAVHPRPCV